MERLQRARIMRQTSKFVEFLTENWDLMMFLWSNHGSLDLLGLSTPPSQQQNNNQSALIDVLGDIYNSSSAVNNGKK